MPSMIPSCAAPAPMDARKAGRTQYAISLAVSLRNEVKPNAYIFRGVDWERGGGGVSISVCKKEHGAAMPMWRAPCRVERPTLKSLLTLGRFDRPVISA